MSIEPANPTTCWRWSIIVWMLLGVSFVLVFGNDNVPFIRFELKPHGIRTEALGYVLKKEARVSVIICARECASNTDCEMIQYDPSSEICSLFSRYMSADSSGGQGVYARAGAIDKLPCTPIANTPNGMTMKYSGLAHGDTVTYTCDKAGDELFRHDGIRTCISGSWNNTEPSFCMPPAYTLH